MANTIAFKDSKTKENLMRAFAGESQARNRYTISAAAAKKNNLHVVEAIFTFTADQEKEHAEIFWNLLKEMSGNNVEIDGSYPVEVFDNVLKLLRAAEHNENEEYEDVYRNFADVAKEEGFFEISAKFDSIAKIEKTHSDRFKLYADMLENNNIRIERRNVLGMSKLRRGRKRPLGAPDVPGLQPQPGIFHQSRAGPVRA